VRVEGFYGGTWIVVASQAALGYAELPITATTYNYPADQEDTDFKAAGGTGTQFDNLRFFAYTSRDGYDSWQRHERRRV
jgi:hypothetical protein